MSFLLSEPNYLMQFEMRYPVKVFVRNTTYLREIKTSAKMLATVFQDLFKGVYGASIDLDLTGSGRILFYAIESYLNAINTGFVEIKSRGYTTEKIIIDPFHIYSKCAQCKEKFGNYFCQNMLCSECYCLSCWQKEHVKESIKHHKRILRKTKELN